MAQAIAYLGFNGNCADAVRFYERALGLGATIEQLITAGDTPMADQIPKEYRQRVIHARLRFGDGSYLFAGDAPAQQPYESIKSVSIAMNYPTVAEAERVFKALAEGGQVTMPPQPMFWASMRYRGGKPLPARRREGADAFPLAKPLQKLHIQAAMVRASAP
jgi:PhnB protein